MATARTLIRTTGIPTVLKRIIAGNNSGYGYTYVNTITDAHIGDRPETLERMREFPFVNIDIGSERCANSNAGAALQTGGNRQLWHNSFDLALNCFMHAEDISLAQDNMLADIQAAFGNDYTIAGTAFSCAYQSSEPFGIELQMPNCGITIIFTVWYRIFQTNPDTRG